MVGTMKEADPAKKDDRERGDCGNSSFRKEKGGGAARNFYLKKKIGAEIPSPGKVARGSEKPSEVKTRGGKDSSPQG